MPTIAFNGESRTVEEQATVATLLAQLALNPQQVAVERNREIVPRARYGDTELVDGDTLEVVTFVGGG